MLLKNKTPILCIVLISVMQNMVKRKQSSIRIVNLVVRNFEKYNSYKSDAILS